MMKKELIKDFSKRLKNLNYNKEDLKNLLELILENQSEESIIYYFNNL